MEHRLGVRPDGDDPLMAAVSRFVSLRSVQPDASSRVQVGAAHAHDFPRPAAGQLLHQHHGLDGRRDKREDGLNVVFRDGLHRRRLPRLRSIPAQPPDRLEAGVHRR